MKTLQQIPWAEAQGIQRRTRLHIPQRTWKTSIWSQDNDEEMTLPDIEKLLV